MNAEAAGHAPMLSLKEVVQRYAILAGDFGQPVALSAFGLARDDTQNLFSSFDEDYHISRFLHFSCGTGQRYTISGEAATHIAIEPAINSLL
jgi:hypothetical protein